MELLKIRKIFSILGAAISKKINFGDDTSYMRGKRAKQLRDGASPMGWGEAFMFSEYVKDSTDIDDPLRAQFSFTNNIKRIINYGPLMLVILILGFIVYHFGLKPVKVTEYPFVDDVTPNAKVILPKYITRCNYNGLAVKLGFNDTRNVYVESVDPMYRVLKGGDVLNRVFDDPRDKVLAFKIVEGGVEVLDPTDQNYFELLPFKIKDRKYYVLRDSTWIQVHPAKGIGKMGILDPDYALVAKGTNIVVKYE